MEKTTPQIPVSEQITSKKVAIVYASWHESYITRIRNRLKSELNSLGVVDITEISAPGSNEVPWVASKIAKDYHGIICVGVLIKGDTLHFENVSGACSNGIMQAQIMTGVPMLNVILSCYNYEQLEERISGDKCTLDYIAKTLLSVMKY